MPEICGVFVMNVTGQVEHRETKHCICISVSQNKYFMINTDHRDMYDDFEIKSSDYEFLEGKNRFVCCSRIHEFEPDRIIRHVGTLRYADMLKIIDKIQNSKILDKTERDSVMPELDEWQADNS
jgi:hypothetical protein